MLWKATKFVLLIGYVGLMVGVAGVLYVLWHFGHDLPDHDVLRQYSPPTITRVHAGDGKLIAEYAEQHRVYVPITNIPKLVVDAFIAAEDKDFFTHFGIDLKAIARASLQNVPRLIRGQRPIGASTITQQVAKNFLLSSELSLDRKIREVLLALRIENTLSKEQILDLYLNEIYLGKGAYGIAAAAMIYFDKSLGELTIAEAALLAALPKAPGNYDPWMKPEEARQRRDWVIGRMAIGGFIDPEAAEEARNSPMEPKVDTGSDSITADYFVEYVRQELADQFGIDQVNRGGLSVRTTLDTHLQKIAFDALVNGLIDYDRRHGYRGPIARLSAAQIGQWPTALAGLTLPPLPKAEWQIAVVLDTTANVARIGLPDSAMTGKPDNDRIGEIPLKQLGWARTYLTHSERGKDVRRVSQVLKVGDVVAVAPMAPQSDPAQLPRYSLQQIPAINGGIIALDPFTGRVLAMQGGLSFRASEYNRSSQARRQPGSAFKPFVYLAALESGLTPATKILDAPFVLDQGKGRPKWKPHNYSRFFYGLVPMRIGIEQSRNLMTVRLAQQIGMGRVAEISRKFGLAQDLPPQLSAALGAHEVTLLDITTAYGQLVNGGRKITPTAVDRVQDRYGKTLYLHDSRLCQCSLANPDDIPILENHAPRLASPQHIFQIVSMLQGVVKRGTARSIARLGLSLAGKTGTSNDSVDTWFIGFSPNLAVGVYVGFDQPQPLGAHPAGYQETGSSVAAPIFREFMRRAMADVPKIPFRIPGDIQFIRIDPQTGQRAKLGGRWIDEAFVRGTFPGGKKGQTGAEGDSGTVRTDGVY